MSRRRRSARSIALALLIPSLLGAASAAETVHKVGQVTWHPQTFLGKPVSIVGYVLAQEPGTVMFSDEPTGKVSAHDLPVTGTGVDTMALAGRYRISGIFVRSGLAAGNGNPYHLELTEVPVPQPR